MMDLEAAMLALSKFVSTVVEDLKSKTKWAAEVEIKLMSDVFAVPRGDGGKTVQQQQDELCEQCAELIATKLLALFNSPGVKEKPCPKLMSATELMEMVRAHMSDPEFEKKPLQLRNPW